MRTINSNDDLKRAIKDGVSEGKITNKSFMKKMIKASEKSDYVKFRNDKGELVRAQNGNVPGLTMGIVAETILAVAIGLLIISIAATVIISTLKDEDTVVVIEPDGTIKFKRRRNSH